MKLRLQFIIAAFIVLAISISATYGQANLTFSGGNNTPVTITLQQSVSYTVNANCTNSPLFVFDEVGNPFAAPGDDQGNGTITYTVNNGAATTITATGSGFISSNTTTNDIFLYGLPFQTLSIGNTVILNAGTFTTTQNFNVSLPPNGSYTTFLTSAGGGQRCSANGAALGPTAAPVSISGRVLTSSGRGIKNVQITMTDSLGNERTATSTAFGYYHFDDVMAGETVTLSAKAKRFRFNQSSIVRTTNESITDADFVSEQ